MSVGFRLPFFFMLFSLLAAGIMTAHSAPAPAPAADCSSLILNLADCLSYVTVGGTAKKPEGTCCSGLKTVLKTDADCLCEALKNSAQLGVTLNVSKALTLPAACHVSAPSVSNCALSAVPGAAPAPSPLASSPNSIVGAPSPAVGGNEGAPTPTAGNSGSSALTKSVKLIVFTAVAAVSFALF